MSFDVKLVKGDLSFDDQGRIELVRNNNKLVQEVLKLISTTLGSDAFVSNYGISGINDLTGSYTTAAITEQRLESEIRTGIENLLVEQRELIRQQVLTPGERIRNIDRVVVEQDELDPRQYNVYIELTTGELTPITVTAEIRG